MITFLLRTRTGPNVIMAKKNSITSIITGDLVKSRNLSSSQWLPALKRILSTEGDSPKTWEIYRGDSFQIEVKDPTRAFLMAVRIKAAMKRVKHLDVRMAIGIGTKETSSGKITENNGEAFINSGEKLEELIKLKQTMAVRSPWPDFDRDMNLYIRLALIVMDSWSTSSSELVSMLTDLYAENRETLQTRLASKLKITQSSVSARMKRAYYSDIVELFAWYEERVKKLIQ